MRPFMASTASSVSTSPVHYFQTLPPIQLKVGVECQEVPVNPSNWIVFKIGGLHIVTAARNQRHSIGHLTLDARFFTVEGKLKVASEVSFLPVRYNPNLPHIGLLELN